MKKLILYDLDGTLVDTRRDIINSVRYALNELNGPQVTDDEIKDCVGSGLHALIRKVFRTQDEKLADKGSKLYRTHYIDHMLDYSVLYPEAKDVLEYFKDRKQAVVTNKPSPFSQQILEGLGISEYFIDVLTGDNGIPHKPDPGAIFHLMERTVASKEEVLFVGDSLVDIETARNAGVEEVVIAQGFNTEETLVAAKPSYLVKNCGELLQLIKEKKW